MASNNSSSYGGTVINAASISVTAPTGATNNYALLAAGDSLFRGGLTLTGNTTLSGLITGSGGLSLLGNLTMTGLATTQTIRADRLGLGAAVTGTELMNLTTNSTQTLGLHINVSGTTHTGLQINTATGTGGGTHPMTILSSTGGEIYRFGYSGSVADFVVVGPSGSTAEFRRGGTADVTVQAQVSPSQGSILRLESGNTGRVPLELTSGTLKTTPENGGLEYSATFMLHFTRTNNFRETVLTGTMGTAPTTTNTAVPSAYYGTGGVLFLSEPQAWITVTDASGTARRIPAYNP